MVDESNYVERRFGLPIVLQICTQISVPKHMI